MQSRLRAAALALVVAAAAAGCGGDGGNDDTSSGDRGGGDERTGRAYAGELEDGSRLRVHLDAAPDDPAVAPYEAFRQSTGGPEVTWIVAEIAVPDGVEGTGRFLTFVEAGANPIDDDPLDDRDGITNAEFVCSQLDDWAEGSPEPEAAGAAYLELYEGPCGGQTLQVLAPGGQTTTYVMVYEGALPDFDRVFSGLLTELRPA